MWTFYGDMVSGYRPVSFVTDLFPPGSENQEVRKGQLLGYQGQVSETGLMWTHLRFAVVPAAPDGSFPAALVGSGGPEDPPLPFELARGGRARPVSLPGHGT